MEIDYCPTWKKPQNYGRQCQNAKGVEGNTYVEHDILKVLTVRKRIVFDQKMCMAERE